MIELRITELRNERGWEQKELISRAGYGGRPATVSELENGRNPNPGYKLLEKVADALGVRVPELFVVPVDSLRRMVDAAAKSGEAIALVDLSPDRRAAVKQLLGIADKLRPHDVQTLAEMGQAMLNAASRSQSSSEDESDKS